MSQIGNPIEASALTMDIDDVVTDGVDDTTIDEETVGAEELPEKGEDGEEGENTGEEESIDESLDGMESDITDGETSIDDDLLYDGAMDDSAHIGYGMDGEFSMETGTEVKDPLMSNWFFVGGIAAAVLVVGIAAGVLLAKWKIKKGIDLYEN